MAVNIVDASALAALLFGEPEAEAVMGRLGDGSLVAHALLGSAWAAMMPLICGWLRPCPPTS